MVSGEIDWAVHSEAAHHVEDVVYRRARVALYDVHPRSVVEAVADRMQALLGWDVRRRDEELSVVRNRLASDLAFGADSVYVGAAGQAAPAKS